METGADYIFSYDTSTQQGRGLNRISTEVYNKTKQYYGDVRTAENRSELGQNIENWITSSLNAKSVEAVGGSSTVYDLLAQPEFNMSFQVDVQIKAATVSIGNGSNRGTYLVLPEGTGDSSAAYLGDIQLSAASSSAKAEVMGSNNYSVVVLKLQEGKTLANSYSGDDIRNMKYRSSEITNISITSGVSSANISQSNVAVSSDGAA